MSNLFDALDLPERAQSLQDTYWEWRRECEKTEAAFQTCLRFLLEPVAAPQTNTEEGTAE